jgi:hypothetical protein
MVGKNAAGTRSVPATTRGLDQPLGDREAHQRAPDIVLTDPVAK